MKKHKILLSAVSVAGLAVVMPVLHPVNVQAADCIPNLMEYILPEGLKLFRVEDGNWDEKAPVMDYEIFYPEDFIPYLWDAGTAWIEEDTNNDGVIDQRLKYLEDTGNKGVWKIADTDFDGITEFATAMERIALGSDRYYTVRWVDQDRNGTFDTVSIAGPLEVGGQRYGVEYVYGDFEVVDQYNNVFDYTNEGSVRYIQVSVSMENHPLGEIQIFRDYDGDGYFDLMQIRRFYDTDSDGVKESMAIWNDRDMDGNFEDQYQYDGTIFDDSPW